jgi:hypothetical protein
MAWEHRQRGGPYYTRSRREDGRVVREYIGTGELAETLAHADEAIRRSRAERVARERDELEEARGLASAADELHEVVEVLTDAEMLAAGFHRHKGQWRRRRDA